MSGLNWHVFRAKHNGQEQRAFEELCYLLFCSEFNQDIGILRYKKQIGIETEPIHHQGKLIGFQAKYYETKISNNVRNLKQAIDKAKDKNPDLGKIVFYINQEFSESTKAGKKEPQYKIDIEKHAAARGLEVEWRVPSHIERQLALDSNMSLAKRFFTLEKSTHDLVRDLIQHTESILAPIRSHIEFRGDIVKLDRSAILDGLKDVLAGSSIVVLSGKAGAGKTAVIKDFYEQIRHTTPMFVFKATEFRISNINDLFHTYGDFTLADFVSECQRMEQKYVVIDSAERLSEIEDQTAFQELLLSLTNNKWKVILTTRYSYLDDLKFLLIEVFRLPLRPMTIEEIEEDELKDLSIRHGFNLPENDRLLELLRNPFYLAEYLGAYDDSVGSTMSLLEYRDLLWNRHISRSVYRQNSIHTRREDCFLQIALKRAKEGRFFVNAQGYDSEALQSLEADEIIKYDANAGGYFITHDIYEEWALDKIIERSFISSAGYDRFFASLGSSLPIRRALRNWLTEKLLVDEDSVKSLIQQSVVSDRIESFWKDEIIVSILMSGYAGVFFRLFETELLENDQEFLIRAIFLLRIACKEVDYSFLARIGLRQENDPILTTLFTQPKGSGWACTIDFIHRHKEVLGTRHISAILPMLADWNNKNAVGDTTKKASQICLFYYESIVRSGMGGYDTSDVKKQVIRVMLRGSAEIKEELRRIFEGVLARKSLTHRDRDYELVEMILTSMIDGFEVVRNLPDYVVRLAELFWTGKPRGNHWYEQHLSEVESAFGLSDDLEFRYYPSSALQTPIYQLLMVAPEATVDFILSFVDRAVENYAHSTFKHELEEVQVVVDDRCRITQYVSDRLWNAYRGTQVSTHLLESMHMALEKWLLGYPKIGTYEQLEDVCCYLVKNSRSASITAVVASVVMAYPSKLFSIARILFRTKEFFFYDTHRMVLDLRAKNTYSIGYGLDYEHDIHLNERIKTCDDPHRKKRLEDLAVEYQFFRTEDVSAKEAEKRQKALWEIFDEFYNELEGLPEQTESQRTWRLYLARMDRRKMNPRVEQTEEGVIIEFNPQIEPELREYGEESLQEINEAHKHMPLSLWSSSRFSEKEDEYCKYQQYEANPHLVLEEVEEILRANKDGSARRYRLLIDSIPAYACSVLIRDFASCLSLDEMEFCRDVVMAYSTLPFRIDDYTYQVLDGSEPAISALPYLLKYFTKDARQGKEIKRLLMLTLLSIHEDICAFAARAVLHSLWKLDFTHAHSIFLGYLRLKPKYDHLVNEMRKKDRSKGIYKTAESRTINQFVKKYGPEVEKVLSDRMRYSDVANIRDLDFETLTVAFELLPLGTSHPDHVKFVQEIFPIFAQGVFEQYPYRDDKDRLDYRLMTRFLHRFAAFVLCADKEMVDIYVEPFVKCFEIGKGAQSLFSHFITAEDGLGEYDKFWKVWHAFYERVKAACTRRHDHYETKEVVHNYLLAWPYWKETVGGWHSLKDREKSFYKKVSEDMGRLPSVLYSISKVLNEIGSNFLEDGILWLSSMIRHNNNLLGEELEVNTIYYIERVVRRYILEHRQAIRTMLQAREAVVMILNFLVERGSATGYLLRESIL